MISLPWDAQCLATIETEGHSPLVAVLEVSNRSVVVALLRGHVPRRRIRARHDPWRVRARDRHPLAQERLAGGRCGREPGCLEREKHEHVLRAQGRMAERVSAHIARRACVENQGAALTLSTGAGAVTRRFSP